MDPAAAAGEATRADDFGSASGAAVDRPLAGSVALDGIVVANLGFGAEFGHGRSPSGAVAVAGAAVAIESEEMGVLVDQRREDAFGRVEHH